MRLRITTKNNGWIALEIVTLENPGDIYTHIFDFEIVVDTKDILQSTIIIERCIFIKTYCETR